MTPPPGAWMTRKDDVMEIGCHSGAKSWTLKCENNEWAGTIGQCGHQIPPDVSRTANHAIEGQQEKLSLSKCLAIIYFVLRTLTMLVMPIFFIPLVETTILL